MVQHKVLFLLIIFCMWRFGIDCSILPPTKPLRSHITGGYKGIQMRNSRMTFDCTQYANDYEVLFYLPFPIMINPMTSQWDMSHAKMDNTDTFIVNLYLLAANDLVPSSIFCLKKVQSLYILNMLFSDGVLPDSLTNMRMLRTLQIMNTPIKNVTDKLASLTQLSHLELQSCSLSQLPDLTDLQNLLQINLRNNKLSKLDGLNNVGYLYLDNNLFTEIPVPRSPETLYQLSMSNNPLKHVMTLGSFVNVQYMYLHNTNISAVPPSIDKLQQLYSIDLSNNKLFYLPVNVLKLKKLRNIYLTNNAFTTNIVTDLKRQFNQTLPNATLYI